MTGTYTKNLDGSFTEVANPLDATSAWITARSGETSTLIGAVTGTALAPTIFDNASRALVAGLAGDYISAATYGIPAVIAVYGALLAIIKPDKGLTDEQIHTAVSTMSREQLVELLNHSSANLQPSTSGV